MPGLISVPEFVRETKEDYSSPTTSTFVSKIPLCRETIAKHEEALSQDRDGLVKLKTTLKDIYKSGINHHGMEMEMTKILDKMGDTAITREDEDDEIGAAFQKFAVLTKELSLLMKHLMTNLNTIILYPVENVLKNEMRGSKGDLKRPFDRAWRDYTDKYSEIERTKKKQAEKAGMIRSELTAGEIAEDLDKERKYLQISMADYLLKLNEIKSKKGSELLSTLLEYYKVQLKTETFQQVNIPCTKLKEMQSLESLQHEDGSTDFSDEETLEDGPRTLNRTPDRKNRPISIYTPGTAEDDSPENNRSPGTTSDWSRSNTSDSGDSPGSYRTSTMPPPPPPQSKKPSLCSNLANHIVGSLKKGKSANSIPPSNYATLPIHPSKLDPNSPSPALSLPPVHKRSPSTDSGNAGSRSTTPVSYSIVGGKHLISPRGKMMHTPMKSFIEERSPISTPNIKLNNGQSTESLESLTYHFQAESDSDREEWMSVLLNSKEKSLNRAFEDNGRTGENQGLVEFQRTLVNYIRSIPSNQTCCDCGSGNDVTWLSTNFGIIVCIECSGIHREMGVHISKIQSLTLDHIGTSQLLVARMSSNQSFNKVMESRTSKKLKPTSTISETFLHLAISQETGSSLHIVDFIVQNSSSLDRKTKEGNTPLHYCVIQNQPEAMRLLLRSGAAADLPNNNGKTPLSIARERGYKLCEELRDNYQRYKKRCRALYDCEADNEDELTFEEGDIIIILAEETEDDNWMEGVLETEPDKRGLFPASFVHMLSD
ncbi:arf-GAP with SH3 domain, ANK repeat and PH domain-containing protein 2 [Eurytemora carolleeae]|uniref:arf-GAP with SH3 domain, ANK repeat and PH domain-containing protein 2 n=1 Tax=Eurytemora carolleeae TaxID=1294199 RepID=UPI000C78998E|nr:arf-GAP with SH3 domain, ANK repeat and PH domain-containing protein 2 [Eurytemora carolleeae]|eukprot:XP_023349481.1 arf-GAP with SH3 domain, ANK repeat and PH domain-containing protein 2-like [Eurytemora affinis]